MRAPRPRELPLLDSADIRLLTEVGFLAAGRGDVVRAEAIFGALARVRAERSFAYVGLALCYLNAGRADDGARLLERHADFVVAEDRAEMHAFRALVLQLAGRHSESRRALAAAGGHALARHMAGDAAGPAAGTSLSSLLSISAEP